MPKTLGRLVYGVQRMSWLGCWYSLTSQVKWTNGKSRQWWIIRVKDEPKWFQNGTSIEDAENREGWRAFLRSSLEESDDKVSCWRRAFRLLLMVLLLSSNYVLCSEFRWLMWKFFELCLIQSDVLQWTHGVSQWICRLPVNRGALRQSLRNLLWSVWHLLIFTGNSRLGTHRC